MTVYATEADLIARLSPSYSPSSADATKLLTKASEVIDEATLGLAAQAWADDPTDANKWRTTLKNATCDQVEFWLEVGEEHDVQTLGGSVVSGRLQIHPVAPVLGRRAARTLKMGGLWWRGVGAK